MGQRIWGWALVLSLLAPEMPAWAWSEAGHMATAAAAYLDLDPATRGQMAALLRRHPSFQKEWAPGIASAGIEEGEYLFMRASVWPDDIRSAGHPMSGEHVRDAHFINLPFNPSSFPGKLPHRTMTILKAIEAHTGILSRQGLPATRARSLAWILHLVGDLQQPMHAVALISSTFKTGDLGGNSFKIKPRGPLVDNLHAFWDHQFDRYRSYKRLHDLALAIRQRYTRGKLLKELMLAQPAEWANESYDLAAKYAYQFAPNPAQPDQRRLLTPGSDLDLAPGYVVEALDLSTRRVAVGGYRLADTLRTYFLP